MWTPRRNKEKFVQYDYYGTTQDKLDAARENATKYGERAFILFIIEDLVATALNATLIASGHPEYQEEFGTNPRILPGLQHYDHDERTIEHVWNKFYCPFSNKSCKNPAGGREPAGMVLVQKFPFNFVYCGTPMMRHNSFWNFSLFTDPFDCWTWLSTIVTLVCVSFLAFAHPSNVNFYVGFFLSLSALFEGGVAVKGHSILFTIWMLAGVLLATLYSGHVTSKVISPIPEESLTELRQLESDNFTLIFDSSVWPDMLNSSVHAQTGSDYAPEEITTLGRIMSSSGIELYDKPEFIYELAISTRKVASAMLWPWTLGVATAASKIAFENDKPNLVDRNIRKKCYIGKKLIPSGEAVFGFTPPGSYDLSVAFQKLVEAGLVYRFIDEYFAQIHSSRVQDRQRVISPTNLADGRKSFVPLSMVGETAAILRLWMLCLGISFSCFAVCE